MPTPYTHSHHRARRAQFGRHLAHTLFVLVVLVASATTAQDANESSPPPVEVIRWDDPWLNEVDPIWMDESSPFTPEQQIGHYARQADIPLRVLHIGAHPDDENSALIAWLARTRGFQTAYLSATRGEGGQNSIGTESGMALAVIRTEELLAARRWDGAEQLFLNLPDFGFSKTATEALDKWKHEEALRRLVATIRAYRPLVIITVFGGEQRDGHGHHQAIGQLAYEAFELAGDPSYITTGEEHCTIASSDPWTPAAIMESERGRADDRWMNIETGEHDPLYDMSAWQIAAIGRSQHISQDMQMPAEPGTGKWVSLLTPRVSHGTREKDVRLLLERAGPSKLDASLQAAIDRYTKLSEPRLRSELSDDLSDHIQSLLRRLIAHQTVQQFDLFSSGPLILQSDLNIAIETSGDNRIRVRAIHLVVPDYWSVGISELTPINAPSSGWTGTTVLNAQDGTTISTPRFALPSAPDNLPNSVRFPWQATPMPRIASIGQRAAEIAPFAAAIAELDVYGITLHVATQLEVRPPEDRLGVRPPATLARLEPSVTVSVDRPHAIYREAPDGRPTASEGQHTLSYSVAARGITSTQYIYRHNQFRDGSWDVSYPGTEIATGSSGHHIGAVRALGDTTRSVFTLRDSKSHGGNDLVLLQPQRIDYEHITPRVVYHPAIQRISRISLNSPANRRVAYVEGPMDQIARVLNELGIDIDVLTSEALASTDWDDFDTVVIGPRAYEFTHELRESQPRLMQWTEAGGTLIVQYQKYPFEGMYATPYPFKYSRPHDRITVEDSPVTLLMPEHPLFHTPNTITTADFDGWEQERALYGFGGFDDEYTPLMAMADPGESPTNGYLLEAEVGEGLWIYCALSLFRQIPEGHEGATKLLVNMIARDRNDDD